MPSPAASGRAAGRRRRGFGPPGGCSAAPFPRHPPRWGGVAPLAPALKLPKHGLSPFRAAQAVQREPSRTQRGLFSPHLPRLSRSCGCPCPVRGPRRRPGALPAGRLPAELPPWQRLTAAEAGSGAPRRQEERPRVWKQRGRGPIGRSLQNTAEGGRWDERSPSTSSPAPSPRRRPQGMRGRQPGLLLAAVTPRQALGTAGPHPEPAGFAASPLRQEVTVSLSSSSRCRFCAAVRCS